MTDFDQSEAKFLISLFSTDVRGTKHFKKSHAGRTLIYQKVTKI